LLSAHFLCSFNNAGVVFFKHWSADYSMKVANGFKQFFLVDVVLSRYLEQIHPETTTPFKTTN